MYLARALFGQHHGLDLSGDVTGLKLGIVCAQLERVLLARLQVTTGQEQVEAAFGGLLTEADLLPGPGQGQEVDGAVALFLLARPTYACPLGTGYKS